MVFNVAALVIGALLLIAGIYYLVTEKHDAESRKIYSITILIGLIVLLFGGVRLYQSSTATDSDVAVVSQASVK